MQIPEIRLYHGSAAKPFLNDLAKLRIEVFRSFPYLYQGSMDHETAYLKNYFSSERSILVTVEESSRIVGASTAGPLVDADAAFQAPFLENSMFKEEIFYFGESVLLPEFRGRGFGHRFFDERESWARQRGFRTAAFCAVEREQDHPSRPAAGYRPLDSFWESRGYKRREDLVVELPWIEVGSSDGVETSHKLPFWLKRLV